MLDQYLQSTDINIKSRYQDIQQIKYAVKKFILSERLRSDLLQGDSASQGQSKSMDTTSTPPATAAGSDIHVLIFSEQNRHLWTLLDSDILVKHNERW